MTVRVATARAEDLAAIEAYLASRSDTCMIMRANLRAVGLTWAGQRYQAQYAVAWDADEVVGVVGHAWNGQLLVQADAAAGALACAVVAASGRAVAGLMGPLTQVVEVRAALGLADARVAMADDETLMALALRELVVPAPLAAGRLSARLAEAADRALQVQWRVDYQVEAMRMAPGEATASARRAGRRARELDPRPWRPRLPLPLPLAPPPPPPLAARAAVGVGARCFPSPPSRTPRSVARHRLRLRSLSPRRSPPPPRAVGGRGSPAAHRR